MTTQPKQQSMLDASTNYAMALAMRNNRKQRNKQRKPKSKPARKQPRQRKQMRQANAPELCTVQYASALMDPEFTPAGACVPYGFPTPSQRVKSFARGTFALGTTGFGFAIVGLPTSNNSSGVLCTGATSVGGTGTTLGAFTLTNTTSLAKLPYTSAQVTAAAGVSARLVSAVLKVRYAGTEANRSGIVTSLEEPQHKDLGALTPTTISGYIQSLNERPKPDGTWHTVKWSGPINATEAAFVNTATFVNGVSPMGFVIDGQATDLYEFEYFCHMEYAGSLPPSTENGHSDTDGYSKVITATKEMTNAQPLNDTNSKSALGSFLASAGSSLKDLAVKYGPMLLDGVLSPRLFPMKMFSSMMPGLMQPGKPMLLGFK